MNLGFQEIGRQHKSVLPQVSEVRVSVSELDDDSHLRPNFPTPDTSQMIPFKPKVIVRE